MGNLRGGYYYNSPVFLIGIAAVVFNMAVLHGGGLVPALHPKQSRLPDGGSVIALPHIRVLEDIAGKPLVELRRVRLYGLLHIQHKGQLLIFHLQRPERLIGRHLVFRNDCGDIIAVIADMAVEQMPVRHILMSRVHGPRMTCRWKRKVRHIKAGQHLDHPVNGLRRRGVNGAHKAVGDLCVLHPQIQSPGGHPVLIILRAARYLIIGVHTAHRLADRCAHGASLLFRIDLSGKYWIYYKKKHRGDGFEDRLRSAGGRQCPPLRQQ